MNPSADSPVVAALFYLGVALLVVVTAGAGYLSYVDSEDRKREREERELFQKEVIMEQYAEEVEAFKERTRSKKRDGAAVSKRKLKAPSTKGFSKGD